MGTTRNKPYHSYMRSRKWKRFRKQRILAAGEKCEKCGRTLASLHRANILPTESNNLDKAIQEIIRKPRTKRKRWRTNTLQVHHIWYDNLYRETHSDTRVLCKTPCHKLADAKRKRVQKWLFKAGFYQRVKFIYSLPVTVNFKEAIEMFIHASSDLKVPRYVQSYLKDGY